MALYFVEYILALIISTFDNKRNRVCIVCLFGFFTFFFAFRDISMTEGSDIDAYRFYYENINNSAKTDRFAFESGYVLINKAFHMLHLPFEAFMISVGIFFCCMFWIASKHFEETPGLCLLPSLFLIFYYAIGALRQSIAQILFFYALYYLTDPDENRKTKQKIRLRCLKSNERTIRIDNLKKYYILIAIACLFHRTAVILFLIPFLAKRRNRIIMFVGAASFEILFPYIEQIILMIPYLAGKYGAYRYVAEMGTSISSLFSFRLLEYLGVMLVLLLIKNKSANEKLALQLVEVGIIIQIVLVKYIGATYRLLAYTDFGLILFAAEYYKRINPKCFRVIYTLGIAFVVFYRFYNIVSANTALNLQYGLVWF